jgi:hypothetical protein
MMTVYENVKVFCLAIAVACERINSLFSLDTYSLCRKFLYIFRTVIIFANGNKMLSPAYKIIQAAVFTELFCLHNLIMRE